jgi:hypothetical protein
MSKWRNKDKQLEEIQQISRDQAEERAAKAKEAQEAGKTMSRDDAADKGRDILSTMAELYQLIDWAEEQEDGDPYMKMVFYKSGKFTIETYKDDDVAEFTIDQITQK